MAFRDTTRPVAASKSNEGTLTLSERFKSLVALPKQEIPDPFDVKANAAQPMMGPSDLIPEWVERKTGSAGLGIVAGFLAPSPINIGKRLGEKLGIMAGKTGTSRIPVLKEEQKFTSKYFGERYEFHPPETLISKAKSGELDKKIKQIVDKQESLYKEKDKILDGLPDDIYTKDFDLDLTKVPKDKADRISKIYDELDEINQTKLGSIISKEDFPELAQAYPEIFDVSLHPYVKAGSKVGGSYYPTDTGKITFNIAANKNQSSLEALMHEIQHGIQDIESGTTKAARTFPRDLVRQRRMIKQQGGDIGKDIPFEKEAYESGLRDAYPELRGMARETAIPSTKTLQVKQVAKELEQASWTPAQKKAWGMMGDDPLSFMEFQLESARRSAVKFPSEARPVISRWLKEIEEFKLVNKIKD